MSEVYVKNWFWNPIVLILDDDFVWDSGDGSINNWKSEDGWARIENGVWYVKRGFKWDGCSGVPDFSDDPDKPGFPKTWKASLIHDVGCQYSNTDKSFPYKRHQVDKFFYRLLKEINCKTATLYYYGVSVFGFIKKIIPTIRYTRNYNTLHRGDEYDVPSDEEYNRFMSETV